MRRALRSIVATASLLARDGHGGTPTLAESGLIGPVTITSVVIN
jgi:hypothetical protein